jgi:hypothetical protein
LTSSDIPRWNLSGDWFDVCKCKIPCPCSFAQTPSYGDCDGVLAYHIKSGQYGNISLDGLNVVALADFQGNIWAGNTKANIAVFFDESANDEQREALNMIFTGKAGGFMAESTKVPQLNLPMTIVRHELQLPSSPEGVPGPFSLSDLNELRSLLLQVGFSDVRIEKIQVTFEFDSAEDFVNFTKDIAVPVNVMLANETEMRKKEVWKAVTDQVRLEYSNITNGPVSLNNEAICVVGRRK